VLNTSNRCPRDERAVHLRTVFWNYTPYALFFLAPVLALLLKVFYLKRDMVYGEHLVTAFHAQTVLFIFGIIFFARSTGPARHRAGALLRGARPARAEASIWRPLAGDTSTSRGIVLYLRSIPSRCPLGDNLGCHSSLNCRRGIG
jgi:hypothetical protein